MTLSEAMTVTSDLLKTTRSERGMSMRAAAAEIGVGFNTVRRIEQGLVDDICLGTLAKVLDWCDKELTIRVVGGADVD